MLLQFDIDRYGQFARLTNVADLLELGLLQGRAVSKARVADWLDDLDLRAQFDLLSEKTPATMQEVADFVFELLAERSACLEDAYPFSVVGNSLKFRGPQQCMYLDFLGLTVAHAYELLQGVPALFEEVVAEAFRTSGWKAYRLGANRTKFAQALEAAGNAIGIKTFPSAAVHSRAANDEGADVLARLPLFRDDRDGQLLIVGQATLEKSSGWEKKVSEVKPNRWRKYLGTELDPIRVFATPYHVELRKLARLLEGESTIALDRLRLVQMLRTPNQNARSIWTNVASQSVELWQ
jgi:hypothetical protein